MTFFLDQKNESRFNLELISCLTFYTLKPLNNILMCACLSSPTTDNPGNLFFPLYYILLSLQQAVVFWHFTQVIVENNKSQTFPIWFTLWMRICSFHPCWSRSRSETMEVSLAADCLEDVQQSMRKRSCQDAPHYALCPSVILNYSFMMCVCLIFHTVCGLLLYGVICLALRVQDGISLEHSGFRKTASWNEALEASRSHRLCFQRDVRCAFCMNHCGEPYFSLAASAQLLSLQQRRQCRCTVVIGKWDYDHITF